jgi:molybdopterin/thiamine biosynthesis adenylyltransferase
LRSVIGDKLFNEVSHCNMFMVGAGAIGCELLKNFAMIGLGTSPGSKDRKPG